MENPPTSEDIINALASPFTDALDGVGVTKKFLAKRIKAELNAKQVTRLKVKGALGDAELPKTPKGKTKAGVKVVAKSGLLATDKDGQVFGDGDTVIQFQDINWLVRQKARMDAHKLRGDYPAVKNEHSGPGGGPILMAPQFTDEDRAILKNLSNEVVKEIVERSIRHNTSSDA